MYDHQHARHPILTKWALKMALRSQWVGVPTDKDGGMFMHDRHLLHGIHEKILSKCDYVEINPCEFRIIENSQQDSRLCGRIGALDNEAILPSAMRKSILTGDGWVARLIFNVQNAQTRWKSGSQSDSWSACVCIQWYCHVGVQTITWVYMHEF